MNYAFFNFFYVFFDIFSNTVFKGANKYEITQSLDYGIVLLASIKA